MLKQRRRDARTRVLAHLTDEWKYGLDLLRATRLRSGRFYPAIHSLVDDDLVEACWDELEPTEVRRRRMYRLAEWLTTPTDPDRGVEDVTQ